MRILYCCNEYPPYKSGGIGSVTKIIAESLVKKGHNIYIAGFYPQQKEECIKENINGVVVYRLNKPSLLLMLRGWKNRLLNKAGFSSLFAPQYVEWFESQIENIIKNEKIEILEVPDFYFFNVYETDLQYRKFSVPTILRIHGSISFMQNLSGHPNKYSFHNDYNHFSRCDYISSVSNYSRSYIASTMPNLKFKKDVVIYNPIEDSFLKKNTGKSLQTILFLGKIKDTKGAYNLIQSFCEFSKNNPLWQLRMIGGGDIEYAKSIIPEDCKDKIKFMGYCDRETIKCEIDDCSFVCIPTYFENFSIAALEVMGRNKALIYTERTSGPEIITNMKDGILVDPENNAQITDSLSLLSKNIPLRNELADNAFTKIHSHFTVSAITKEIESFYNSI